MGKNFMGYNNASELITAIGNKIKAKYTKPNTGIPKSDLATAVQTSLDQISTNQANILYGLNTGVKNLLIIKSAFTNNGLTSVRQPDGYTVKITGTPTGGKSIRWSEAIKITESGTYKVKLTLSGTGASCYLYDVTASTTVREYYSSNTYDATLTANHEYAMYTYSTIAVDATISAMICTEAAYAQSTDYMSPALPNSDLTRLEAEDRAALIDQVDSGAKNLLDISKATFGDRSKITFNSDGSVTGNITDDARYWNWENSEFKITLQAGTYVLYCKSTAGSNINWGVALRNSTNTIAVAINYFTGKDFVEFTLSSATELGFMGKIFDRRLYTILCTKAAFNVSQKFVPYKPRIIGVYSGYQSITTSTTLTTTGLKFTATEPGLYRVTASALFNSAKPTQLRINQSYTGTSWYNLVDERSTENTSALTGTAVYSLETGGGFELFAAYSSASSNFVGMVVEKIG